MTVTARLAFTTDKSVRATFRGKNKRHQNAYIRVNGKTISGWVNPEPNKFLGFDYTFFPKGNNAQLVKQMKAAA